MEPARFMLPSACIEKMREVEKNKNDGIENTIKEKNNLTSLFFCLVHEHVEALKFPKEIIDLILDLKITCESADAIKRDLNFAKLVEGKILKFQSSLEQRVLQNAEKGNF